MNDIYILGWIYGKLESELGEDYDKDCAKCNNAAEQPWIAFGRINRDAMKARKVDAQLKSEIANAVSRLSTDIFSAEKLPYDQQSAWFLGYYAGRHGKALKD